MATNTLDAAKKAAIITIYKAGTRTIHQLAVQAQVSRSTIRRVLNEAGEYTPEQIQRSKGETTLRVLEENGVHPANLKVFFATLKMMGMAGVYEGGTTVQFQHVTRERAIKYLMDLNEDEWQSLLNEVVTARVAKAHNVHTSSAMLRIEEKVAKNARDSKG